MGVDDICKACTANNDVVVATRAMRDELPQEKKRNNLLHNENTSMSTKDPIHDETSHFSSSILERFERLRALSGTGNPT